MSRGDNVEVRNLVAVGWALVAVEKNRSYALSVMARNTSVSLVGRPSSCAFPKDKWFGRFSGDPLNNAKQTMYVARQSFLLAGRWLLGRHSRTFGRCPR